GPRRRRRHAAGRRQSARRARGGAAAGERQEGAERKRSRGPARPPRRAPAARRHRRCGGREGRDRAGARPRGARRTVAGARVEPRRGAAGRRHAGRRPLHVRPLPAGAARRRPRPLRRRAAPRRGERGGARRRARPPPPGDPVSRCGLPAERGPGARGGGAVRGPPPRAPRLGAHARRPVPFAARAHLGDLECRVAMLGKGNEGRKEVLAALRAFARDAAEMGLGARAALLGAVVAAGATPPDQGAVVELLDGFEKHYPDAQELHPRALELRLAARVATGQLAEASRDLDAFLALRTDAAERRGTLTRLGRELATRAERAAPAGQAPALALARRVYAVLVRESDDASDRIVLADLDLRAGDAAAARALYEEVLKADAGAGGDQLEARRREMQPRVCR